MFHHALNEVDPLLGLGSREEQGPPFFHIERALETGMEGAQKSKLPDMVPAARLVHVSVDLLLADAGLREPTAADWFALGDSYIMG